MALPAEKLERKYTYADYLQWPASERWELIDGKAVCMSPAPSSEHQRILRKLSGCIGNFLEGRECEVFFAPFDVRLPDISQADEKITTVVQPDLVVVCDPGKIDKRGCLGAPDLIVEILSPATARKDWQDKRLLYERAGVREYWLVDGAHHTVMVYELDGNGKYGELTVYGQGDSVPVGILQGELVIALDQILPAVDGC